MLKKVEKFCLMQGLLNAKTDKAETILIACSGGPDSMALVDVFRRLQAKYNLKLHVAHAEHGIRGKSSLDDAAYVKRYCESYGLPFHLEHLAVPEISQRQKLSMETAARELRYQFLRSTAQKIGAAKIATAHHLNDQAETVLQHLLRGAGMEGLSGMKVRNNDIVRPFLCLYREEIEAYCRKYDLKPCLDATNLSLAYERNRIRWELLPQLKEYNPQIVEAICRSAAIIAEENDFFCQQVKKVFSRLCTEKDDADKGRVIEVNIALLQAEHPAVRKAVYRQIMENILGNLADVAFLHIDKIDMFVYNSRTGAVLQLPHRLRFLCSYGKLKCFRETEAAQAAFDNAPVAIDGNDSKTMLNEKMALEVKTVAHTFALQGRSSCFIDADKLTGALYVRTRRAGDRIIPKGMKGSKKLKDIFIDRKIPASERDSIPLLCDAKGIVWIMGVQQSAEYLPEENSKHVLYLNFKNIK